MRDPGLRSPIVHRPSPAAASLRVAALFIALVSAGSTGTACSSAGDFVWYSQLPLDNANSNAEYLINAGDLVSIRVLGHDEMTVHEHVRFDGRIAMPLLGEIDARGKKPGSLRAEIEGRLKDFIVSPSVILSVDEVQPMTIVVMGEVAHPGAFPLPQSASLAQALAQGGGLTEFAHRDKIFVLRQAPKAQRIRFTYDAVSRTDARAAAFPLHPGDVVVVE
jgi:polysaccharide export outer membrane protein